MATAIIGVNSVAGITAVHSSNNSGYDISFIPDFSFNSPGNFSGSFYVEILDGSTVVNNLTVTYSANKMRYTLQAVTGLSANKQYKLVVSGSSNFPEDASRPGALTTCEYCSPCVLFQRDKLTMKWDTVSSLISYGEIEIGGDWRNIIKVIHDIKGYTLPVTPEIYGNAHFTLSISACLDDAINNSTSYGPPSTQIDVYLQVPEFNNAEYSDGKLNISYTKPAYLDSKYTVCLVLAPQGITPDISKLIAPINGTTSYDVSNYNSLKGLCGYLFVVSNTKVNGAPLFANYNITSANSFSLDGNQIWRKGYYPIKTGTETVLVYAENKAALSAAAIAFALPLYVDFQDAKSITVDGLSLAKNNNGLTLTVDTTKYLTAANLTQFLSSLFDTTIVKTAITPKNYYALRGIIARTAVFVNADANYVLNGIGVMSVSGNELYSYQDILPGNILRIQTSEFRRQTDPKSSSLQGYTQNSQAEYFTQYNEEKNRLDFDANLSLLLDSWTYTKTVSSVNEIFGGAVDFSLSYLEKPYARLISTGCFFPSNSFDDSVGPATGMSIFFADSITILNGITSLTSNSVPNLSVQGRAAITVCVTVFFGTMPYLVPAGTTIAMFALKFGINNLDAITLKRRNYTGEPVNVNCPLSSISNMPLINGDVLQ